MREPSVRILTDRYLALLAERHIPIEGLYLVGSISLNDYQPGRSDVDFIAVLPPGYDSPDFLDSLEDIHKALSGSGPVFDGVYIEASTLRNAPDPKRSIAYHLDETLFRAEPCSEINPVTWLTLRQGGVTLKGASTHELGIPDDLEALKIFEKDNLNGYWARWVERHRAEWTGLTTAESSYAEELSWGALGVARLAYTLQTGAVNSKTAAGLWARHEFPAYTHLFDTCLNVRSGQTVNVCARDLTHGLDFMQSLIETANRPVIYTMQNALRPGT